MFANLFDKVPAKRAGVPEDIVGTILYLVSKAGVINLPSYLIVRHTSMDGRYAWMGGESLSQTGKNDLVDGEILLI